MIIAEALTTPGGEWGVGHHDPKGNDARKFIRGRKARWW
jgi:hypothetical protein